MADRAAPMSSEEERASGIVLRELRADRPCRAVCDCARCEYDRRILDAYKEQIERRVLAQQPCYREWEPRKGDRGVSCAEVRLSCAEQQHTHTTPTLCPPCQARAAQTQETSG